MNSIEELQEKIKRLEKMELRPYDKAEIEAVKRQYPEPEVYKHAHVYYTKGEIKDKIKGHFTENTSVDYLLAWIEKEF